MKKFNFMFTGMKPADIGVYSRDLQQKEKSNRYFNRKVPNKNSGMAEVERIRNYFGKLKKERAIYGVYTEGPYEGITKSNKPYWLAHAFLDASLHADLKAFKNQVIINALANKTSELSEEDVQYIEQHMHNADSSRPEIIVTEDKMPLLDEVLHKFLQATYDANFEYNLKKDATYHLHWLIKNMTNSDADDLVNYVKRYTDFTTDTTFKSIYDTPILLGDVDGITFNLLNVAEYESGFETPYLMLFWAENGENSSVLPFIRYGIENTPNGKTAYIYAVQKRELQNTQLDIKLNSIYAGVNSGVKQNRNITPSMLCASAIFLGMLKARGVNKIKAPDFILRRWGAFHGVNSQELSEKVQGNATDKFLRMFTRLQSQFEGIDITAFPNEVDSFMHLKLNKDIKTDNKTLAKFYEFGYLEGLRAMQVNLPKKLQRPTKPNSEQEAE